MILTMMLLTFSHGCVAAATAATTVASFSMGGPASVAIVAIIPAHDNMAMCTCFRGSRHGMAGSTPTIVVLVVAVGNVMMSVALTMAVDIAPTPRDIDKPGSCTSPLEGPPRLGVLAEIDIVP